MKRLIVCRIAFVFLTVILTFLIISPLSCKKKDQQTKKITIGATLPLSGDAAVWGNNTKEGIELAVEEINNNGGVLGKKIVVVYEDTQALPEKGVSAYRKLTQVDKVPVIIDDSVSSVTLAMAPLTKKDNVVILATGATAPKISEAGPYFFRIWNSDAYEGEFAAQYAFTMLNLRKVAILFINNDYGRGLEEVFKIAFLKQGGKVVTSESFEQNSADMRSQVTKIKAAGADGLYLIGYPKETPIALRQTKELGLNVVLIGTVAMNDPKLIETAGNSADGLVFPYPKDPTGQHIEQFKNAFKNKYSKDPGSTADVGYDAVKMIKRAIVLSKGHSGEDIRKGLNKLKDYPGASGIMTFDKNGDVHKSMGVKIIRNNSIEWLK